MFFQSLQQVAVNDAISRETRANAYLQLCYANINSFGTAKDFAEAIQCLKAAAGLGSAVAASILRPLMLATGHPLNPALENELKRWLVRAVEHGSLLARKELRFLDDDPTTLRKAEEPHRLFMGAKMPTVEGVADADRIEMMFLPANLGTMRVILGAGRHPVLDRIRGSSTKFMSRSMNTYLHAGAALGVDPDHFRNVISVVDTETINTQDDVGNTALHLAIRFGNVEIAQILLEHKASASLANKRGETPWHWFISLEEEDIDLLAFLMMDGVDGLESFAMARNSEDNQYAVAHGGTPLHWAVDMRLRGMATTLLNYGANPLLEYQGVSPIDLAIQMNAVELLKVFLKSVAEDGLDALPLRSLADLINMQHAAKKEPADKDDERVDTLLFQTAGLRPLHERLIYGGPGWLADTISTLGILHEYDYLPSWGEENGQARLEAFRLLSFDNTTGPDMMKMMINTIGVFPGGPGEAVESTNEAAAAFWKAALNAILKTSLSDMVHFAIDKVREYSSSSRLDDAEALLHGYCASLNADITVVESILKDCSSVDCTDEKERTPLMNAVRDRNFEIATCLLERGADVNRSWVHNGERVYILYEYVVNNTDIDVISLKYFLEPMHPFSHKTPPLLIGPDSKDTVLHQACKDGNPVIVDYLLSKFGSNDQLNQPGEGGFTALHHAVFNGHADLVMKLCQSGADANARSGTSDMVNQKRSRPLDLCFRWATPSEDFLAYKFGLERAREDIFLGRLRIADFLVRRHRPRSADRPRRADRFLMHRSPALKLASGAAEDGMTRLLAVVLRVLSKEMDSSAYKDIDYPLLLTNLLWVAAPRGHISTTRLLLNLGADIKQRSLKGLSLLHVVSWLGKAEMVYVLVKNGGADINAEDAEGLTVGSYSHWSKNLATVRMVKSLGGYVTIPRASMKRILASTKGIFPMDCNPGFIVKLRGEPSDDDISDKRSDADRSDGDDDNEREGDKGADDESSECAD